MNMERRRFLQLASATALATFPLNAHPFRRLLVRPASVTGFLPRLAGLELLRGLERLRPGGEVRLADRDARGAPGDLLCTLAIEPSRFRHTEAYEVAASSGGVSFTGASERGLLHAIFDFLERQGAFFGIDGESYPLALDGQLRLPEPGNPWAGQPRFAVRGLLPWPDFLNCITVYNEEDFLAYFEAMLRMRLNTFGMHVYTGGRQWTESYLGVEFAGAGHLGYLDTTATNRWGYLPQRTSAFGMGAAEFYDGEVFGADAARQARDPWEAASLARGLLRKAFARARDLGIRTGIGFEPYQIPDEIWRALPTEVRPSEMPDRNFTGPRFDMESRTAKRLLEARLAQLLEAYPDVDHVWLWEDEQMNWESRRTGVPLSVTPFLQAHAFLARHAPSKRLVVSGWGGVARHFEDFHRRLPGDVIFSCLSDSLGWDPVDEVYGKLEGRERWPIPWLEDDPGMWQAQFHTHRFDNDIRLAEGMGCQGMLGIHWRHRIVDPTAGFFARSMWDEGLRPHRYYRDYARSQASGARAEKLASTLEDTDRFNRLLSTHTGARSKERLVTEAFSGDYGEAFTYWSNRVPRPSVVASQKQVQGELQALVNAAEGDAERERLAYLAGHVEFLVPYAEAWTLANRLHAVLRLAAESRKSGKSEEAAKLASEEGLALWLQLAPEVRRSLLAFQRIVATRNDLGTLASKHNKFARLALTRLRLSLEEFIGDFPAKAHRAYEEAIHPDHQAPARLFLPTRPGLLRAGERVRVMIVAPGTPGQTRIDWHVRLRGERAWRVSPARLLGRRTYEAFLGPFPAGAALAAYYASATVDGRQLTAPAGAPREAARVTIV